MKVYQLREYLEDFDEQAEVFVTLIGLEGTTEIYEITSATNSGGHLELNIDEADARADSNFPDHEVDY
ncbi:MAG: hypothetical protein AB7W47_14170 [Calditrichaceae bacterium]